MVSPGERMRLQKYLARAGVASRRASEALIQAGRVRVDGKTIARPGVLVAPGESLVEVDSRPVHLAPARWIVLHKPPGVLCTREDTRGRPTVYDLLDPGDGSLFHVGRLDYMSEGLLLLTNEGDVAHALLHPSRGLARRYEIAIAGPAPPGLADSLVRGVELDDGPARARRARVRAGARPDEAVVEVELREGRNREIRRMMAALGVTIHSLRRVAFGPVSLGDLPRGAWRELTEAEARDLRESGED
ncbi:MAG: pseudouridine synthase [Gemmatimonadota bacterium]